MVSKKKFNLFSVIICFVSFFFGSATGKANGAIVQSSFNGTPSSVIQTKINHILSHF